MNWMDVTCRLKRRHFPRILSRKRVIFMPNCDGYWQQFPYWSCSRTDWLTHCMAHCWNDVMSLGALDTYRLLHSTWFDPYKQKHTCTHEKKRNRTKKAYQMSVKSSKWVNSDFSIVKRVHAQQFYLVFTAHFHKTTTTKSTQWKCCSSLFFSHRHGV